ncbi:hypothetical protein OHT59_30355 [Streptomyces sp. NBC_00243]|uniref:hypothetical protein n=1 Tax=Streptomyces sp. NBC_00243 TaxID=2975688 RepID=UPI002DD970D7|nr:hypothetical protein [Streptomyces sp. NBC_00243]WRZ22477.1 hypothetical protein OHT59_30355 [Streptomyces sp. NBC_00243]
MPWVHGVVAVAAGAGVWMVPDAWVRAVACAAVLFTPVWGLVVAARLGRVAWLHELPDGEVSPFRPKAHVRGLRIAFAVAGGIGVAVTALVPESWLRWGLPLLAAWAVVEVVRRSRGPYRRAGEVRALALDAPWHEDYRALIEDRRRELSTGPGGAG